MTTYSISKTFKWRGAVTDKVASVCRMFGLSLGSLIEQQFTHECRLEIESGDVVYLTGPSGAGKSVLLTELQKAIPSGERINLAEISLPAGKTLIDCIEADVLAGLRFLSVAGLNDCFCILNQPVNLSSGQQYRFRLAMALATGKKFIFADEFCSELDSVTAAVISYRLHRFAKRTGTTFILASSRQDILLDLAPDVLVAKELSGPFEVIYKHKRRKIK
ncbi:MAG: ATP-binding cassette domain-containing protein [Planctomycetota bacterium]|jgi:ABC-type ATPase with predicted acetyltransferase domain